MIKKNKPLVLKISGLFLPKIDKITQSQQFYAFEYSTAIWVYLGVDLISLAG